MNFLLSNQQIEVQDTVRRYLTRTLPSPRLHACVDSEAPPAPELWQGFAALGAGALLVPEEQGGLGLELIDAALVAEALGYAAAPLPFVEHSLATLALRLAGSADQQARWLPVLADGSRIATIAWRDRGGWQPEQWQLAGGSRLSGDKQHVSFAETADLIVVGTAGGGLHLVERGAARLQRGAEDGVDRTRRLSSLRFEETPAEPLPGASPAVAGRLRDAALVLLAADAFGGALRCLDLAVDYARTRQQFGVVIGQFQALKHQLANMAVEIEPARGLWWYAAHAFDHVPEEAARHAALAKAHLADRYLQLARDAVEAHGGIGYTWEYDLQIHFKRAMFDAAWLGSAREHRARATVLAGW